MRTIYKYELRDAQDQDVRIHQGAEILAVEYQYERLIMWAIVDTDAPVVRRRILLVETGDDLGWYAGARLSRLSYVGTLQTHQSRPSSNYVTHVFDGGERP